jgi:hypothetical protein
MVSDNLPPQSALMLFIVRHHHDAARCPATDPYVGATL